ncbi:hypothetical protein [Ligilactobacillus cholophilus]|uniref:hypothetical protein n=1 Tax=Ligilactobacillus cholophilus TaxID=3050131 RepID=UPI0025B2464F|nr:hypothetical protein [Ligilactobacillus cholophilus]
MKSIDINEIAKNFQSHEFYNEDDIKIYAYSDIILPIQNIYAPNALFQSEHTYLRGGRADGTISNLVIEYKKKGHFKKQRGKEDALFGRKQEKNDSGLYQYIINSINGNEINDSILETFGLGFDGEQWLVARFAKSKESNKLDLTRTRFEDIYGKQKISLNYKFKYKTFPFKEGIEQIITLISSTNKIKKTYLVYSILSPKWYQMV